MKKTCETLVEKKGLLKEKRDELLTLKQDFCKKLNSQSGIYNVSSVHVESQKRILISTKTKINEMKAIVEVDKKEKTHTICYSMEETIFHDECLSDLSKYVVDLKNNLNKLENEVFLTFTKEYTRLKSAISRAESAVKDLKEKVKDEGDSNYLDALKSYLCSKKDIVEQDKKDFIENDTHSKEIVYFDLSSDSKTLYFQKVNLRTVNEGKRRFYSDRSFISKKDAMKLLEKQIFVDGETIKSVQKIPFYEKKEKSSYYSSYEQRYWSIKVDDYINKVKPILMKMKLLEF